MITKIVSGGQTGVDRAALDFAIAKGIPHGGYCPKGRRSESGRIPDKYHLVEISSVDYLERTRKNVEESDGTLIMARGRPEGGTLNTIRLCRQLKKPHYIIDLNNRIDASEIGQFAVWLAVNDISILNVAGPRTSKQPGISKQAKQTLELLIHQKGNRCQKSQGRSLSVNVRN